MKKTILMLMCMASLVLTTACGGANKKADADGTTEAKTEAKASKASDKWGDNDLTKLLPKPDFKMQKASYKKGKARELYSVEFPAATREQIKAYADKLTEAGFEAVREIVDKETSWRYDGCLKNQTGDCYVTLIWFAKMDEDPATIYVEMIFKEKKNP